MNGLMMMRMKPYRSSSAFLWINLMSLMTISLLCFTSSEVDARAVITRNEQGNGIIEEPQPGLARPPSMEETGARALKAMVVEKNDLDTAWRDKRTIFTSKENDRIGVKHVQRIPISNQASQDRRSPLSDDQESEQADESLEANREAFLELLKENAIRRHRTKKIKSHPKFNLRFDPKTQRWQLTEDQSDEWFQ